MPPPTYIGYSRLLTKGNGISIDFRYTWLAYTPISPFNDIGEVIQRTHSEFSVSWYKQLITSNIKIIGKVGFSYRSGGKLVHLNALLLPNGTPFEPIIADNIYKDFGGRLDIQAKYRILWNFNLFVEVGLAGHFSEYDPYQLHSLFGLSYEF